MKKQFIQYFILILSLFVFASCGEKKIATSNVKLNLGYLITSGSLSLNGGVVIIGHTLDDKENLSLALPNGSTDFVLELKKGKWEFAAMAWNGATPMSGETRCSYSGVVDINTDAADIKFNMTRPNCKGFTAANEVITFSPPAYLENDVNSDPNQFKRLEVRSCLTLNSGGVGCTDPSGLTMSYRFVVPGFYQGASGNRALPSLMSGCFTSGTLPTNGVRLPVGTGTDDIVDFQLLAYRSSDCTGDELNFFFRDRSPYMGLNGTSIKSNLNSESMASVIYIEHNPETVNEFNPVGSFFGFGRDGDLLTFNFTSYHVMPDAIYGRIKSINSANPNTIHLQGIGKQINLYDEVLWYVNFENSANSCGASTVNRFTKGMFGIATVKQKSEPDAATTTLVLTRAINDYQLEDGTKIFLDIPTDSSLLSGCSIQVVKIMQYRNISFPATLGSVIKPPAFSEATGIGGILALKVADNIYQTADQQGFDVSAKGLNVSNKFQADCFNVKKRCMQMGEGAGNSLGGGIAMIQARNHVNQAVSGSKFKIAAAGAYVPRFEKIYAGVDHACGLNNAGDVYCWGKNDYGQLGNGAVSAGITHYPQRINLTGVTKLALGAYHTCALTTDNKLICWGLNSNGQIGNGTNTNVLSPNPATPVLTSITDVTAGIGHTCAIDVSGAVKCWGEGSGHQLGIGSPVSQNSPTMTSITSFADKIYSSAYSNTTCAKMSDSGNLKCWGNNTNGQLGIGTNSIQSSIVNVTGLPENYPAGVAVGAEAVCIIRNNGNGNVRCWGNGTSGQLGNGLSTSQNNPSFSSDVVGLDGVVSIKGHSDHFCALTNTKELKCWGFNADSQLGDGTYVNRNTPVAIALGEDVFDFSVGNNYVCARLINGNGKCWGNNTDGIFGNGTVTNSLSPVLSLGSAYTKGGHSMVSMRNLLSPVNAIIELNAKDSSNTTNTLYDGPVHFRFCAKDLGFVVNAYFNNPPAYQPITGNSCF